MDEQTQQDDLFKNFLLDLWLSCLIPCVPYSYSFRISSKDFVHHSSSLRFIQRKGEGGAFNERGGRPNNGSSQGRLSQVSPGSH